MTGTLILALFLLAPAAVAQTAADKAKLEKKVAKPQAGLPRHEPLNDAQKMEQRRQKALSKASKERHKDARNSIRNER
jgi:hypothetical protein